MRKFSPRLTLALLCAFAAADLAAHQGEGIPVVTAVRTDEAPVIDGIPDEAVWNLAPPIGGFIQQQPDTSEPATERTEVRLLYDDHALYVAAWLFDEHPVTTLLARRDSFLAADWFAIYLDPHHDHRTGVMFRVNPVGVVRDSRVVEDDEDRGWDAVWSAASSVVEDGWRAEMRIPWSQLRFPRGAEHLWGINFHREIARNNEYSRLVETPRNQQGFVSRFAHLAGVRDIEPRRGIELLPYVAATTARLGTAHPDDPFSEDGELSTDFGLDFKIGLATNLTLTTTVNPDFGQVEVDPAQINLTAFELFFPERRPFFIEGSNLFAFDSGDADLFYSRRIGRAPQAGPSDPYDFIGLPQQTTILGAAKLTGRTSGGWSVAALDALTDEETAAFILDGEQSRQVIEPMTNYFVTRIAKDFGENARLGGTLTSVHRDLDDGISMLRKSAWTGGIDGYRYFGDKDFLLDVSLFGSQVEGSPEAIELTQRSSARYYQRPDADHVALDPARDSLEGWGAKWFFGRLTGNLRYSISGNSISPGFESNDLGFLSTADRAWTTESISWVDPEPGRVFREWAVTANKVDLWNHDGDRLTDRFALELEGTLLNYWGGELFAQMESPAMDDRATRGGPLIRTPRNWLVAGRVQSDFRNPLSFSLNYDRSGDDLGSDEDAVRVNIRIRPASHVEFEITPQYSVRRDAVQYVQTIVDPMATATFGARYLFAEIDRKTLNLSTRIDWAFTPNLSLQVFLQPFVASGAYSGFKELAAPASSDYLVYGRDRGAIELDEASNRYFVDPGAGGASFVFRNPDFNFRSLRGNAVLRWEFRPGSTIYFAWNENRSDTLAQGDFDASRDLSALSDIASDDVFLIKLSYWLGL